ncbi:hypothetical protein EZ428_13315 [Pedobacter frigiditerrae]|uniref:Uncharacterized protein n=1 Tax=Pedobacter frigiditerrae TaxID=2530452 RepID=A0A4R0MTX8_9SPHI|nr:hypothetical protein [Pedobacter frigiditerrae]TCC90253.1 hypothetical protein EZ428_13315 [Pedobacter frigiditerrae]
MRFIRIIRESLIILLAIVVIVPLLLLFFPVFIFLSIKSYFDEKAYKKAYEQYVLKINNANFFCYNNKQSIQKLIEQEVLPLLNNSINVIYLDGRNPVSDFNKSYISTVLYGIKDKKGFPYILKIRDGVVVDKSINADLYYTINHNESMSSLVKKIDLFFKD